MEYLLIFQSIGKDAYPLIEEINVVFIQSFGLLIFQSLLYLKGKLLFLAFLMIIDFFKVLNLRAEILEALKLNVQISSF